MGKITAEARLDDLMRFKNWTFPALHCIVKMALWRANAAGTTLRGGGQLLAVDAPVIVIRLS